MQIQLRMEEELCWIGPMVYQVQHPISHSGPRDPMEAQYHGIEAKAFLDVALFSARGLFRGLVPLNVTFPHSHNG